MRPILAAIMAVFLLWSPVSASWSSDPIELALTEHIIISPVDHETWCGDCNGVDYTTGSPWTVNPGWVEGYIPPIDTPGSGSDIMGGCLWDVDDTYQYQTSGNVMDAAQVLAVDECIWQGPNLRRNGGQTNHVLWRSPSPDLLIRHEWTWILTDGTTASASYTVPRPTSSEKGVYTYQTCIRAPGVVGGVLVAVPGSHDGEGVYQVLTITITNPGKRVAKTGGYLGADPRDWGSFCRNGTVDPQ